ncbi:MAG TPA: helix-turn-helix transcriptional regulator [Streptosporangiaceae bacterium]|nr:helix-turn-helix transcriptional regulator [Streptosporangiaceae bacterium]
MADEELVAGACGALGRQLAASRRAAGLSQEALARLAEYSRSTVANVETGRQRVPRGFWARCDAALGTGTALVRGYDDVVAAARRGEARAAVAARRARAISGDAAGSGESVTADVAPVVVDGPAGADHLEALRLRLGGVLGEGAVSATSLDAWDQAVVDHGRATRYRPPGELLLEVGADLAQLEGVIRRTRSPASLRRLARVAGQLSGLVCLLLVKGDERDAFGRWVRTARTSAGESGDAVVLSWVLAQEAYGHYYSGDLREAVSVARHAQALVPRSPSAAAVLAAALEARAHAVRGDVRETRNALARAETGLGALEPGSLTASAFGYSESQFRFHESSAYTRLGDTRSAVRAQDRALELCPPGDYTDRALSRLDRAACLAHDGDPVSAVAYAAGTMAGLRQEQSQGIIALRCRELVHALPAKYQGSAAVSELRELLPGGEPGEVP